MSVSTNGQLSYGVVFDEDIEFPWDSEEFEGSTDAWWRNVNDYVNPHYYPFTKKGTFKDDAPVIINQLGQKRLDHNDPRIVDYYNHWREWEIANPIPVELVNYCGDDYPMYLLVVKHVSCSRGYPLEVDPAFLEVTEEEKYKLREFLDRFGIEADEPKWWLTSYWG